MRILCEALGFGVGDNLGGSVRVAQINAKALAQAGHDVTFYCTNLVEKGRRLCSRTTETTNGGVRVVYFNTYTVPFWRGSFGPSVSPDVFARLRRELAEQDVVHLYEFRSFLSLTVASAAFRRGIPYALQPQGTLLTGGTSAVLKRCYDCLLGRRVLRRASRVVAATMVERQMCLDTRVPPGRVEVIPNGYDVDAAPPAPAVGTFRLKFGLSASRPIVLTIGRLDYVKAQDLLVAAIARLPRGQVQLVIIGADHGLRPEIERVIATHDLSDAVLLTGALSDEDVTAALVDCDVFALPSRFEAFGMAILEACRFSKPLLLSSGCQNAAAFRGRAALVVPPDAASLAEGIARLVSDAALRESYGRAANVILQEEYTLAQVCRRLEHLYHKMIEEHAARQSAAVPAL